MYSPRWRYRNTFSQFFHVDKRKRELVYLQQCCLHRTTIFLFFFCKRVVEWVWEWKKKNPEKRWQVHLSAKNLLPTCERQIVYFSSVGGIVTSHSSSTAQWRKMYEKADKSDNSMKIKWCRRLYGLWTKSMIFISFPSIVSCVCTLL